MQRTFRAIFLTLCPFTFRLFAQSPSVPYAQYFGPDFDNVHVEHVLLRHGYQSIRKVDFRDIKLVVFDQ